MKSKILIPWLEVLFIFVLPMLLLYFGVIPVEKRLYLGIPVLVAILYLVRRERWSLKKIGLRFDNIITALFPYILFTLVGVILLIFLAKLIGKNPLQEWWTYTHFQFLFIPVSIFQEFFFRGFLMPKLQSMISSSVFVIIINALLFTLLHIIFPNPLFMLPIAFLGGLAFATIYKFFPNLILISISHIILNFVAVLFCFFSFANSC
jgi:membrane protease YdiL (CAAX protease family)